MCAAELSDVRLSFPFECSIILFRYLRAHGGPLSSISFGRAIIPVCRSSSGSRERVRENERESGRLKSVAEECGRRLLDYVER